MEDLPTLVLRELAEDRENGSYWREWHCQPPSSGAVFTVRSQEWVPSGGPLMVRRIYKFDVVDDVGGGPGR